MRLAIVAVLVSGAVAIAARNAPAAPTAPAPPVAPNATPAAGEPGVAAPDAIDKPAAERLFDEGRALLDAGHPDEACAKFELSIHKDPGALGTLLNLGLCNERQGKVASALALFIDAYDRAGEAGQAAQREAAAQHVAALRPLVPVVAITFAGAALPGEKLLVDDHVISRAQHELPIDPGLHAVVLTAPGRLPYEATLVAKVSTRTRLSLPTLRSPGTTPRRFVAKLATFGGLGATVIGAGLIVLAHHDYHAQFHGSAPHCGVYPAIDGQPVCDGPGKDAVDSARRLATTGGVIAGIGLATAALGVTLWLTAPAEHARLVPLASTDGGGVALAGQF